MAKKKQHKKRNVPAAPGQARQQSEHLTRFKIGRSVAVKAGVLNPDNGMDIGGWQGRITELGKSPAGTRVTIQWDSLTLRQMPAEVIVECEEQGLDWKGMLLEDHELDLVEPRDRIQDVQAAIEEIEAQHGWSFLGEQGLEIQKVLAGVEEDDEMGVFKAWKDHLANNLAFPFEAEVSEWQEKGPLNAGDEVTVLGFARTEDLYGVMVKIEVVGEKHTFPLCDLEALDHESTNYRLVNNYAVWFANR